MASPANQEYNKMLCTPVLLEGPRKDAIDAIQKRIDTHLEEINKLRSAQNSHVPVSGLPVELLSEVFLCIVQSGLQCNDMCYVTGTFRFRRVCKHWDEVAVGSPQLWVRWASGAVRAWPLFNKRSKDSPIFLTWQPHHTPASGRDGLGDPAIPGRIRQLDFSGAREQLEELFGAIDSNPPSMISSIRVHITLHGARQDTEQDTQHLTRFLSSSFPRLSKLDIENYQLDCSSSVFATSNLTSLKLSLPYGSRPSYTLEQLSRILQKHPNLRELDLKDGATPRIEPTDAPVPFTLPQLVDLKLRGVAGSILRLIRLIGLSLPLHTIVLHFRHPRNPNVRVLVKTVKKILAAYYKCEGLDRPRKTSYFTVGSIPGLDYVPGVAFVARSHSAHPSIPEPVLQLQFDREDELLNIFPLFPLKDTQEFTIKGLALSSKTYRMMFRKMKGVLHLVLTTLDIGPVLEVLKPRDPDYSAEQLVPKLVSLTLSNLDFLHDVVDNMLDVLQGRYDRKIGLKRLVIQSCRVHTADDDELSAKGLVGEIKWIDVEEMGSDFEGSDQNPYSDESPYSDGSDYSLYRW